MSCSKKEKSDLIEINDELLQIDQKLDELLKRKKFLQQKKKNLESLLDHSNEVNRDISAINNWETQSFPWTEKVRNVLKDTFKLDDFRNIQLSVINAILSKKDCISVMPTGGGKSLCYQLPAFLMETGIVLVISPLVSLMEDQEIHLKNLSLGAYVAILNSSSTKESIKEIQNMMVDKKSPLKLLYVTPEKLAKSKRFMNCLEKSYDVGMLLSIAIDEVHCCSQWGHDFRPDYKFLGVLKRQFPSIPLVGLTATASSHVISDVCKMLSIPNAIIFRTPMNRLNLYYQVIRKPSVQKEVIDLIFNLINSKFNNESGIVYCFSQKDTEEVSKELLEKGIKCAPYHANMDANKRSSIHIAWTNNNIKVIVATIAFGMGIDKTDVRFVIHHSISKSLENYYQESGRAGRDDKRADCIMLAGFSDVFRQSTMVFTEQTGLEKLYSIANYAFILNNCRRVLISTHFEEQFNPKDCNQMCNICSEQLDTINLDISPHCREILSILEHSIQLKHRITNLKLLDTWLAKPNQNQKLKGSFPYGFKTSRSNAESILLYLIIEGYLREDFHFTPYNTISYILPGIKSENFLKNSCIELNINLPTSIKTISKKRLLSNESLNVENKKRNINSSYIENSGATISTN